MWRHLRRLAPRFGMELLVNHEPAHPVASDLRRELARRSALDQEARDAVDGWSEDPRTELWDKVTAVDADNTTWLMAIVEQHGWPRESDVGEEAAEAAWLLAQHADDQPELQHTFLRHMASAVGIGEASPRLLAYLDDRVRLSEGRAQLYGTQFIDDGSGLRPQPIEDPDRLAERRSAVGLEPFEDNEARMQQMWGHTANSTVEIDRPAVGHTGSIR